MTLMTVSTARPALPASAGTVTGAMLTAARKSLHRTQEDLADSLGLHANTVSSWESGRRPLSHISAGDLVQLRRHLGGLGADPKLTQFEVAIDVDQFLGFVLAGDTDPDRHYLARWVMTRDWAGLLSWALTGVAPDGMHGLRSVRQPDLGRGARAVIYDLLREAAERAAVRGSAGRRMQLRRQVHFLVGADTSPAGRQWLAAADQSREYGVRAGGWSPDWIGVRSLAVARARHGNPSALHEFVDRRLRGDELCETANLAYWSYWIGDGLSTATSDESVMASHPHGDRLLAHLTGRLDPATPYVDLSAHTLWALIEARSDLLAGDTDQATRLIDCTERVLSTCAANLSQRSRRELGRVRQIALSCQRWAS